MQLSEVLGGKSGFRIMVKAGWKYADSADDLLPVRLDGTRKESGQCSVTESRRLRGQSALW